MTDSGAATLALPVWQNWARTVRATPARICRPRDEASLAALVGRTAAAGTRIRAAGAGHSFTPVAVTDGILLDLEHLTGIESVERRPDGAARVTVRAGTRLYHLHHLLAAHGLAMPNLGDIDRQTLAGSIATGTHGTGLSHGGIATQVCGVRVVTADGAVRSVSVDDAAGSPERDLFELARLGLGAAGVLTAVTLEVVPAFWLRVADRPEPLGPLLEDLRSFARSADHAELYWFPGTHRALTLRRDRLSPDDAGRWATGLSGVGGRLRAVGQEARNLVDGELLSNGALELIGRLATAAPGLTGGLNRLSARALAPRTYVAPSYAIFCSRRRVRFRELEFAVPSAAAGDVIRELDAWQRRTGEPVPLPVEVRFGGPEEPWLSTARGRETAWISVHQYARMPHRRWFEAAERIMVAADGRPHWGKLHTRTAQDLAPHYPLEDVARVRAAVDPGGAFSNPYTDAVLGAASQVVQRAAGSPST